MGFWSSLVKGGENVVNWLGNNAGNIATAATAIAGVLAAEEVHPLTSEDGQNQLVAIFNNVHKAEGKLAKAATDLIKPPGRYEKDSVGAPAVYGPLDLPCFFPDTTIISQGQAPASINKDINKFLALNDLPTTITTSSGEADVGMLIGEQLVTPASRLSATLPGTPANFISPPPFKIGPDANGLTYSGGIVYYPVPIDGSTHGRQGWHSHVRLYAQMTDQHREAWRAHKKSLAMPTRNLLGSGSGSSYNSTTVSATWTGAERTDTIMSAALHAMDPAVYVYAGNPIEDGQKYTYQFHTDITVGPTAVLQAFQEAIRKSLPKSDVPNLPATRVRSQSTIIT